jgi:hypothetical protein
VPLSGKAKPSLLPDLLFRLIIKSRLNIKALINQVFYMFFACITPCEKTIETRFFLMSWRALARSFQRLGVGFHCAQAARVAG